MGSLFLLIACLIFLGIRAGVIDTKQSIKNREYIEQRKRDNFNESRQFRLNYEVKELPWLFEESTGMDKNIIANILSARSDKVPYDPELYCAGGFLYPAYNAIVTYLLNKEGYNANPKEFKYVNPKIDMTIPDDYILQGKLYKLSVRELEDLTGLNYEKVFQKFALLNPKPMRFRPQDCNNRVKGIMVRYQMEQKGKEFFGMHDELFLTSDTENIDDKFSLDDCKNWGTPLEFVG